VIESFKFTIIFSLVILSFYSISEAKTEEIVDDIIKEDNNEESGEIANIDPDDFEKSLSIVLKSTQSENRENTIHLFNLCLDTFEDRKAIFYYNLGVYYEYGEEGRFDGDLNLAMSQYKKCIQEDSDFAPAYLNMAYLYYRLGFFKEALKQYKSVLDKIPNEREPLFNIGIIYRNMGNYEEARKIYESYTEKFPLDDRGWRCLGVIYEKLNDIAGAIKAWKESFVNATNSKWADYAKKRLVKLRGY
jgi:tetratricopeptide (TPR) repeat protein